MALIKTPRSLVEQLLHRADIRINGSRPWDLQVHDERFFSRVLREGSLGLGESYMDGWWDAGRLDEFFARLLAANLEEENFGRVKKLLLSAGQVLLNPQRRSRAYRIGEHHYDIGNDLYQAMLDKRLVYSCAYWREGARNLDEAQEAKLDLVCRKLSLKPGQHVLDIGCGWGSFARFAAERYQARVTGVTVSREQLTLGQELCAGLPVELQYKDYREISGIYDHLVSIGMFEHVGYKNYRTYFQVAARHLQEDGLFLLHTIGSNISSRTLDPWFEKYIFPNSMIPSAAQIAQAVEGLFVIEDWHNFGPDYDPTLLAWYDNFQRHWETLRPRYGDRFYRMWTYYLLSAAATFRVRKNQVWQIVLSKRGVPGGYRSLR
jgi:cyclopropane-fatty-acyl-phospholipid synthase